MPEGKRLFRSDTNRVIAGVAGGLAEYFNVDPIIIRVLFVALVFTGGAGVALYLILWLLMPSKKHTPETSQEDIIKDNAEEMKNRAEEIAQNVKTNGASGVGETRKFLGYMIFALGIVLLLANFGLFRWDLFWPFILLIVGFYLLAKK